MVAVAGSMRREGVDTGHCDNAIACLVYMGRRKMEEREYQRLKKEVDLFMSGCIERFYRDVPSARYQMESDEVDERFYEYHTIQTILRIRLKRMIDALVINRLIKDHKMKAAKRWAEYTEDEMLHGRMFGKDLENMTGITMEEIYSREPLFSTKLLNGYFYYTLEHEGPMAALASAYFLETFSRNTQPEWLDNLEKLFGKDKLKGARAHVNHDIDVDHIDFVWNVLKETVEDRRDADRLMAHLQNLYGLFSAYFVELHQKTGVSKGGWTAVPVVAVHHSLAAGEGGGFGAVTGN